MFKNLLHEIKYRILSEFWMAFAKDDQFPLLAIHLGCKWRRDFKSYDTYQQVQQVNFLAELKDPK